LTKQHKWLLLIYKIPREPTTGRVSVWRKLKQLGAVLLQDAVWVLPETPRTREQFQWLRAEIIELGGEVTVWVAEAEQIAGHRALTKQFAKQADDAYEEILSGLCSKNADLAALSRRYQQVLAQDFFQSKLGEKVRKALLARGD
jgi:DNA-binding transcriptional regulator PaaX